MQIGTSITRLAALARESANRAGTGFVMAELSTGNAFADLALQTRDDQKRSRNTSNAKTAYDTVLRFMNRVTLTEEEASQFDNDFMLLKNKLSRLGVST